MGGVITTYGGAVRIVYCSEHVPGSGARQLAAAVVWRVGVTAQSGGWRAWLRRLRFRVGPFGRGFHLRGMDRHWSGSAGQHGEQETRYDARRRVVWVLGNEYAVPSDGRALVVLIDENGRGGGAPFVAARTVVAPVLTDPMIESLAESRAWTAVLEGDLEVRAFMSEATDVRGSRS